MKLGRNSKLFKDRFPENYTFKSILTTTGDIFNCLVEKREEWFAITSSPNIRSFIEREMITIFTLASFFIFFKTMTIFDTKKRIVLSIKILGALKIRWNHYTKIEIAYDKI